jgi:hypothetical protein
MRLKATPIAIIASGMRLFPLMSIGKMKDRWK